MTTEQTLYKTFKSKIQEVADVNHAIAVLNWDQETYLPQKGAKIRAQQISTLAGIAHTLSIAPEIGDLLNKLGKSETLNDWDRINVKESLREYEKKQKYSKEFVVKLSAVTSECYQAWMKARSANDFQIFRPSLEKMVAIKREECELLGYEEHPYDALLDQYEPGAKTSELNVLFSDVHSQLVDFVKEISEQEQVKDSWMYQAFNKDSQWKFGLELLEQMGYDFKAGRQDISEHPFTTSFGSSDVRVTTRINPNNLYEMIWSCIHEGGHALYEQGLKSEDYGLPTGMYLSLGIHESQSRLWENNVGRSLPYWQVNYPRLQQLFSEQLKQVSLEDFYKSVNIVKPSLIRTNADELTYHFHIMIRFEIEKALIEGKITVADIPTIWNEKYKEYLNLDVPSDKQGCLQDIHWSHGSFGYFPTYSLGSFYAAQFYHQAVKDIDSLEKHIENGNMQPLLDWLRKNIHQYGRFFNADELCQHITGESLSFKYFMNYAKTKYKYIYNI